MQQLKPEESVQLAYPTRFQVEEPLDEVLEPVLLLVLLQEAQQDQIHHLQQLGQPQ